MNDDVQLVDLRSQYAEVAADLEPQILTLLSQAGYVGGPEVSAFEEEYAAFSGIRHCVGVANGTDAVELALRAAGVGPQDEVILPANTFIATAEAVSRIGALPVLVDVRPDTLLIDPVLVEAALTARTKAVVPVHLYGQVAAMEELDAVLKGTDVAVVGDAAQAQGATRGGRHAASLGTVSATSFYPGKNLGAAGDAGAVTTDDDEIAARVRLLANHGSSQKYVHDVVGMNSRLDALQAVVLRHKLRRLAGWNDRRAYVAERYVAALSGVTGVQLPTVDRAGRHVWHLFVVQVENRDAVLAGLHERGVWAGIHYPEPVHLTRAYTHLGQRAGAFPVSEAAAGRILSLPIHPHLSDAQQDRVVSALAEAMAGQFVRT